MLDEAGRAVVVREKGISGKTGVHLLDERYNIEKETIAACKFLKDAYRKYGDWMTVAASYNAGQGGISRRREEQTCRNGVYFPHLLSSTACKSCHRKCDTTRSLLHNHRLKFRISLLPF